MSASSPPLDSYSNLLVPTLITHKASAYLSGAFCLSHTAGISLKLHTQCNC
ncbi:hypothetical protein THF1D04_20120 [Vibrio owensii]|uniref:Uncharacterized protein n=1 Tax=Vibrio owensii TaxID=696485 RepID=A0AAU9Q3P0_9VIBR|nr:hypothetical protein THF1D04_20120 [Vibrio owensii]